MVTQVGASTATITNWANHLRALVTWDIENLELAAAPIGGEGIIVEIDESKFGKRKYNRGHRVEGICALQYTVPFIIISSKSLM